MNPRQKTQERHAQKIRPLWEGNSLAGGGSLAEKSDAVAVGNAKQIVTDSSPCRSIDEMVVA